MSVEKIYQALKTVFDHISKHLEIRQKDSVTRHILNFPFGVWKCVKTQSFVFDTVHLTTPHRHTTSVHHIGTPHRHTTPNHDNQQLFILSTMNMKKVPPSPSSCHLLIYSKIKAEYNLHQKSITHSVKTTSIIGVNENQKLKYSN